MVKNVIYQEIQRNDLFEVHTLFIIKIQKDNWPSPSADKDYVAKTQGKPL